MGLEFRRDKKLEDPLSFFIIVMGGFLYHCLSHMPLTLFLCLLKVLTLFTWNILLLKYIVLHCSHENDIVLDLNEY